MGHEGLILVVPSAQCAAPALFLHDRGDEQGDDDAADGPEERDHEQGGELVRPDAAVPDGVVQGARQHVDGLDEGHQIQGELTIEGVVLIGRSVARRPGLIQGLTVAAKVRQKACDPIRRQAQQDDRLEQPHSCLVPQAPQGIRQLRDQVPGSKDFDVIQQHGRTGNDPNVRCATDKRQPPERVGEHAHHDAPPPHHLDMVSRVEEGHVELQQQASEVDHVQQHVESHRGPAAGRPRLRPSAAPNESQREDAKC
mmetsp:Transcript_113032/g.326637  ORF Transcript_113032/g.326637 Transcript_113032/m.326637 type:complete len:254 (-) Transcript_113032:72-833(-)